MRIKLKNLIDDKEPHIIEITRNFCEAKFNEILKNLAQKMKTKLNSNTYNGKKEDMQRDFDEVIDRYNQ